jgi:homoserine kinase
MTAEGTGTEHPAGTKYPAGTEHPEQVTVFAPATVANVGPGYDVLGLAVEAPGDHVRARAIERPGVHLAEVTGDHPKLPPADDGNTACVAARLVLRRVAELWPERAVPGVELTLHKGLPVGSGLGSSGASAAAAAQAVNLLCGAPLATGELVVFCAEAEAAACGSAHPDNVAPSLLGGVTLVRAVDDVIAVPVAPRLELTVALVTPRQELPTRLARRAIPGQIPLAEALHNMAHLGALICALQRGDGALLSRALSDRIAEPRRAPLIEGFAAVKQAALDAGALGASISGAGPTIFALCSGAPTVHAAADAMSATLTRLGRPHEVRVSAVASSGAREVPDTVWPRDPSSNAPSGTTG